MAEHAMKREVLHQLPGRVRLAVPGVKGDPRFAQALVEALSRDVQIDEVRADSRTGNALIQYRTLRDVGPVSHGQVLSAKVLATAAELARLRSGAADGRTTAERLKLAVWRRTSGFARMDFGLQNEGCDKAAEALGTDLRRGLGTAEAERRLTREGRNELPEPRRGSWWRAATRQLQDAMTAALAAVAALSFLLGRTLDGASILFVLGMNGVVGVVQERRATLDGFALKRLDAYAATVVRDGTPQIVPAAELVCGDVALLETGDRVPADGLILDLKMLEVDESALTGESTPVAKALGRIPRDAPLAERSNALFQGTFVTRGKAKMLVTATGTATQMGRLAQGLGEQDDEPTPLQLRVRVFGQILVTAVLVTVGIVVTVGIIRGFPPWTMVLTGMTLAASAIPEGLPILITIALAVGMRRMAHQNALVRRMSALETLGRATVICSDKTGTLTQNEMTVQWVSDGRLSWRVSGNGYAPHGSVRRVAEAGLADASVGAGLELAMGAGGGSESEAGALESDLALERLARVSVLCNDARVMAREDGRYQVVGDPTEGALWVFAQKAGVNPEAVCGRSRRTHERPFESELRRMSVVCETDGEAEILVKGAVEEVLARCGFRMSEERPEPLTESDREAILAEAEAMAGRALRVIATGYRPLAAETGGAETVERTKGKASAVGYVGNADDGEGVGLIEEDWERDLIFAGLIGMIDPPRARVRESVAACREAGIKVAMITGDHPATAVAIAREIGIMGAAGERVLTGTEIEALGEAGLREAVEEVAVYARVSPLHKVAIVKALKSRGHVVAMTGDGVNDAPAVRQADVGIAMGRTGTEVTKEASALTIADDDFVTIVRAVEEGRGVLGNIRRALGYLLSGNLGEVLYAGVAVLLGMPLPLAPIQILLINLFTDAAPTLTIITQKRVERCDQALKSETDLIDPRYIREIAVRASVIALTSVGVFAVGLTLYSQVAVARTMAFVTLALSQLLQIETWRTDGRSPSLAPVAHPHLAVFMATTAAVFAIVYVPSLRVLASAEVLGLSAIGIALSGAAITRPAATLAVRAFPSRAPLRPEGGARISGSLAASLA